MPSQILVAYASRNGSTEEIAREIGTVLAKAGFSVDVHAMQSVTSLEGYSGVILGAPLYMGDLVKEMALFVARHRTALARLPVASFAVGLTLVSEQVGKVDHAMDRLAAALAPIKPAGTILFAGKLDPAKLGFLQRKMMEIGRVPSGDFRDWNLIDAWARGLPEKMGVSSVPKD